MKKNDEKTIVLIDLRFYSLEAIYGAAYLFLDKAYFYLEEGPNSKIKINIKGKKRLTEIKLENLKNEFLNELLNSSLRDKISKNNKKLREYILGRALASALPGEDLAEKEKGQLKETSRDIAVWEKEDLKKDFMKELPWDWEKDPEGITIPWEEKYLGDKKAKKSKKTIKKLKRKTKK